MGSEWTTGQLKDIAEIVMGQSPKGERCNTDETGTPLLNGPTEFGSSHPYPTQFTTDPKKMAQPGDLLFCVRGSTTGRMNWADQEYAIGRGIGAMRHRKGTSFQPYLRGLIESKLPTLLQNATGSTFPNVSRDQLLELEIEVAPEKEANQVAHILGSLDNKIELNRQTNETLEKMAQALFESWFVDFDAVIDNALEVGNTIPDELQERAERRQQQLAKPGHKPLPDDIRQLFPSEFEFTKERGWVPMGWKIKPLPDVIDFKEGPGIRNWQYTNDEDGIKFVNIRCIKNGDLKLDTASKITKEEAFGKYIHFQLSVDDIVISSSGTLGRFAFIRSEHLPLCLNTSVIRFRRIEGISTLHFITGFVETQLQSELLMRATGSAQLNFGPIHLKEIGLLTPSIELLEAHSKICEPHFRLRQSNLKEIDSLTNIRGTLLPKLISGGLRLPSATLSDAERQLADAMS